MQALVGFEGFGFEGKLWLVFWGEFWFRVFHSFVRAEWLKIERRGPRKASGL